MSQFLFDAPQTPGIPVIGHEAAYPVSRIFCVGRNYAAHAAEMGAEVDREAPFYFTKSARAYQPSGTTIPYPPGTENFHYEMELVVAIGDPVFHATPEEAAAAAFAYGCGLDMTRRDLQAAAKEKGRPWSTAKDVERSAVFASLTPASEFGDIGPQKIQLSVNGDIRQDSTLSDMVWKVDEIITHLSTLYHLSPGDLIMTGTPAGVGAVTVGDRISGHIDGLEDIALEIGPAEAG